MFKRDSSVSITSPTNKLGLKRNQNLITFASNNFHEKNDKTVDFTGIKIQNELSDSQNSIQLNDNKSDFNELKVLTHDEQINLITNIDAQPSIQNFQFPIFEFASKAEEQNTITLNSTNNLLVHKKSIYSPQTKKGNKHIFFSNQNDTYYSAQNSPTQLKINQLECSLEDNIKSPVEKYLNQLHPLPQLNNLVDYSKHLKKQDNLRTYGTMFSQPNLVKLKPQMSERKQTYDTFHQSYYKKIGADINFKGRQSNIQEKKKNKKGLMFTNEFWSDSYYQKVFKSSCLDKIEIQINREKLHSTAKEAQKNMNKYFENLFEQRMNQKQPQQIGTRRRITINQNEFLNNYISNAISTSILSSPRMPLTTVNTEQTQQLIEDTTSQNSILLYQRSPSERSIQRQGLQRQPSITLNNQNIFSQLIKKSAFSQIQGGEEPYMLENPVLNQNTNPQEQLISQKTINNQLTQTHQEQEQQPTSPQTIKETKFTIYDQIIDPTTFLRSSQFDKDSFRLQKQLLSDRRHNSKSKSIHIRQKGNQTSRNTSSDIKTKESPFLLNKNNFFNESSTPFNLENQYLKTQINNNNDSLKHRRCSSEHKVKTLGNEQQYSQEQSQIQKYFRYKTEINQILQDCQEYQEDTNLIKSNLKFKIKEQAIINQTAKDFTINKKKKETLIQFHNKQLESREIIDQKRKYMHSYNLVRAVEFNKQSS